MNSMSGLNEHVKNSELNMEETKCPEEYIKKANAIIERRRQAEADLETSLEPIGGIDDRLCPHIRQLDQKMRKELSVLRKEYNL